MKRLLGLSMCVAALALAACNNSGTGQSYTNPTTCGLQGNTVMIYPINGSTKVPPSTTSVYIVSNNNTLGNGNFSVAIQPPNGLPYSIAGNWVSVPLSQVPKPHAHPSNPNPHYYGANIGGLSAGSTYFIGFNVNNQNCVPVGLGSFTTQ